MAYLFWGYLVVWLVLAGYLLWLGLRLAGLAREVDRLADRAEVEQPLRARGGR